VVLHKDVRSCIIVNSLLCPRGRYSRNGGCSHNRHHPAKEPEALVFVQVRAFLSDPHLMRAGLRELVASETPSRSGTAPSLPTEQRRSRTSR
jgi:hypothetical protein